MVTTAMKGSPVWGGAPGVPVLRAGRAGCALRLFSVWCGPAGAGRPDACARSDLAVSSRDRGTHPRAVGAPEVRAPSWSADVRSQPPEELLEPAYAGRRGPANRATREPAPPPQAALRI